MRRIDPTLLSLAKEFSVKDAVVWDIGANVGMFSLSAAFGAGTGGLVVSLEPDIWLVDLLRRSANIQPLTSAPVKVVPAAVASEVALRHFCLSRRARSANYIAGYGTSQSGGTREDQFVVTVTLDWLLSFFPAPSVLKIDVEGAESEVFGGARCLFENVRPVVLCEVGADSQATVTSFLLERGYTLYDGELPPRLRRPLTQAPWCTVAIPPADVGVVS